MNSSLICTSKDKKSKRRRGKRRDMKAGFIESMSIRNINEIMSKYFFTFKLDKKWWQHVDVT